MYAALLFCVALQPPAEQLEDWSTIPFVGAVAVGDFVVVTEKDGNFSLLALTQGEAAARAERIAQAVGAKRERAREIAKAFGFELPEDFTGQDIAKGYRMLQSEPRGAADRRRPPTEEESDSQQNWRQLHYERQALTQELSAPQPPAVHVVLALASEWMTVHADDGVSHLPMSRVVRVDESAARYAERTGTLLPDEPAVAPADDDIAQ